jgi:hypothetical protein
MGYILIYFLKGTLPWQGIKAKRNEEKFQLILDKKLLIQLNQLCLNIPKEFSTYIEYCRALQFTQEPDYNYLSDLFKELLKKEKADLNNIEFDWNKININSTTNEYNRLNKSTGALQDLNQDKNNKSINISDFNNNINRSVDEVIQKKSTLVSGVRRKNTGLS